MLHTAGPEGRSRSLVSPVDGVWIAFYALVGVALAWWMGQDLNWDLLNYHFYNAYMWLDGRIARDVHAAGIQSYLNPLIDLPLYAAVRAGITPAAFYLPLAAVQGLALFVVHRLTTLLLPARQPAAAAGCLAALTAAFGAGFLSEIGGTMHDLTLAVLVLGAVWVLLASTGPTTAVPIRALMTAGLLAGAATGMKLALATLSIGLAACVLAMQGSFLERLGRVAIFCAAVGGGVLLTGGAWMWEMQRHFGSPLFPFYNGLFQSPFATPENFADLRFMPRDAMQALFYPFYWLSAQTLVTELPLRDGRVAAAMLAVAALGIHSVLRRSAGEPADDSAAGRRLYLLAVFWLVAYAAWLGMFSIYRYLIPLELLSGTIVIAVLARFMTQWTRYLATAVPICLALGLSSQIPNWGRTGWSASYFGVDTGALEQYAGATVLMWDLPQGYLPPLFPSATTFIRIRTNAGMTSGDRMWQRVRGAVAGAREGRLYLVDSVPGQGHEQQPVELAQLGLERTADACEQHASHSGGFRTCGLQRRAP